MSESRAWFDGPMTGFDLETTGVDPEMDRIVTACVVNDVYEDSTIEIRNWIADPGIPIPESASRVHGVTTEQARLKGEPPEVVVDQILCALRASIEMDVPIVGHNISYDLTMLDREARRHGLEPLDLTDAVVIDTMVLDKQVERYRRGKGNRKLTAVASRWGVELLNAHDSEADAVASMLVARELGRRFDWLPSSPRQLHESQVRWRAEQCRSLERYLRKTDKDAFVDPRWPLMPYGEALIAAVQ